MAARFEYAEFKDIVEYLAKPIGISAEIIGRNEKRVAQFYLTGHHNSTILKDQRNLAGWVLTQFHQQILDDPKKLSKLIKKKSSIKDSMEILPFGTLISNGNFKLDILTECHYRRLKQMRKNIKNLENTNDKYVREHVGVLQSLTDIYELHGEEFTNAVNDLKKVFPGYKVRHLDGQKGGK